MKRVYGLDVLRALAISLVIISHCTYILFPDVTRELGVTFTRGMGAVGVDLFFVLSGFLIGGILMNHIAKGKTRFSDLFSFWKRRWLRTLPNYYLFLGINILLLIVAGEKIGSDLLLFVPFLQNFAGPHPEFFAEAWSLSVEEYAYLLLPLTLFAGLRLLHKRDKGDIFLLSILLLLVVLALVKLWYYLDVDVSGMEDWSSSYRKVVIYRLDAVYIGFIVVFALRNFPDYFKKYRIEFLIAGLVLFAVLHLGILLLGLDPALHKGFFVFFYLDLLLLSLAMLFPYFANLENGILPGLMVFLSTRSYAMYLVNYSVVLLSLKKVVDFQAYTFYLRVAFMLLFLVVTFFLSNIVYTYFEKPILKLRDTWIRRI